MNHFFSDVGHELLGLLPALPAVLWAISFHEFCHAWAALKCGDRTAELDGRLTLNPLAHFDPWGAVCMLLFQFGWAKPVPIDPRNFRKPRRDIPIVAIAGIAGNVLSAIVFGLLVRGMIRWTPELFWTNYGLQRVLVMFVLVDLNLAVFNLLTIPPLDGSKLLYYFLPLRVVDSLYWLERRGYIILLALIYLGVVRAVMSPIVRWAFRVIVG